MPYSDEYVRYLEARLADSQQQKKTSHRDVQRLTNTTGNAPLPTRQQIAAAQRQAELKARQQNLRAGAQPPTLPKVRSAPTRQPLSGGEDDYDDVWPPRQHTSSVRYDAGTYRELAPGVYRLGEETVR